MKLGKYILGLALVAAGLTSCDQDNIGAIYEPKVANITFLAAEQSTLTQEEALTGTIALNTISLTKGADILRVHDVREAVECVKIVAAAKPQQTINRKL